jgi:hypothetical protein
MSSKRTGTKVVTDRVRMSFLNWFAPRKNDLNGKEEYSAELLIPKTDTETLNNLKAAMKEAIVAKFGDKPPPLRNPLKDGDTATKQNGDPVADYYKGHFFLRTKSTEKPGVIGVDGNELREAAQFVSGDYGQAAITAFAFDTTANKGVSFYLQNLLFTDKGEAFGGGKASASDDFGIKSSAATDFSSDFV